MKKETKHKDTTHRHKRTKEIAGVVLLALALLLLLCLFSYNPADPSFTHYVGGTGHIKNLGGIVGAYSADSLLKMLGLSTFWIPVVFILISVKLLLDKALRVTPASLLGFICLVFSSAALLASHVRTVTLYGTTLNPGGLLGRVSADLMHSYFNHIGTYLLLTVIFIISIMITIDVSLVAFIRKSLVVLNTVLRKSYDFIVMRLERLRRKHKVTRNKKIKLSKDVPVIRDDASRKDPPKSRKKAEQIMFEFAESGDSYIQPSLSLLDNVERRDTRVKRESLIMNSRLLEKKLADFGVDANVAEVMPGPVITMYELQPAPGVKINKITNLSDDLALALKARSVRIIAPIPGKSVIGIEIPNHERDLVHLKEVLDHDAFLKANFKLPIALGVDIVGTPIITDLAKMPHLLIAGTTGSGKSVSLNAMICSILFKTQPDNVKFLMIDPKRLELSSYEGIPHLLHPVVVNPKMASQVLKWAVEEMERRYRLISESGMKSIEKYNKMVAKHTIAGTRETPPPGDTSSQGAAAVGRDGNADTPPPEKLPYIVIVIDELADLMMVAQRNVEESLARLAQMARAAGIHLILATQRPSVDVITGIIKANFPTRISFQVSSRVDSRTILDTLGAEKLLGSGDMLFLPPGTSSIMRIHGPYVSDREIEAIVEFVRKQAHPDYDESISNYEPEVREGGKSDEFDEKYDTAVELVTDLGQASISLVQRYLKIGYNRAARIIEQMEREGIVGPSDGVKPRKVLARKLPE